MQPNRTTSLDKKVAFDSLKVLKEFSPCGRNFSYTKGNILGKGGFARCYQFTCIETNKVYAIKVIEKKKASKQSDKIKVNQEIEIQAQLHHKNIVNLDHFFEDTENVYLVLEYCPNKTLGELVRKRKQLTQTEVQKFLVQLLSAIEYVHDRKIIHRDLKLSNILLGENDELKLADFGLAAKLKDFNERRRTVCGTPNYMAPEIVHVPSSGYSFEVDIWSIGVILYWLLVGHAPFEASGFKEIYRKIQKNSWSFPSTPELSDEARSLISSLLNKEPEGRLTVGQIYQHDFLRNFISQQSANEIGYGSNDYHINIGRSQTHGDINVFRGERNRGDRKEGLDDKKKTYDELKDHNPERKDGNVERRANTQATQYTQNSNTKETLRRASSEKLILASSRLVSQRVVVISYLDFSKKYGLGYMLSNNVVGAHFNDHSKMLLDRQNRFYYYEKSMQQTKETFVEFPQNALPQILRRKAKILATFRQHFLEQIDESDLIQTQDSMIPPIHVKKWFSAKYSCFLVYSTTTVHVLFNDKTQIIMWAQGDIITYVDKESKKEDFTWRAAMHNNNHDLRKRLDYTKRVFAEYQNRRKDTDHRGQAHLTTENAPEGLETTLQNQIHKAERTGNLVDAYEQKQGKRSRTPPPDYSPTGQRGVKGGKII